MVTKITEAIIPIREFIYECHLENKFLPLEDIDNVAARANTTRMMALLALRYLRDDQEIDLITMISSDDKPEYLIKKVNNRLIDEIERK